MHLGAELARQLSQASRSGPSPASTTGSPAAAPARMTRSSRLYDTNREAPSRYSDGSDSSTAASRSSSWCSPVNRSTSTEGGSLRHPRSSAVGCARAPPRCSRRPSAPPAPDGDRSRAAGATPAVRAAIGRARRAQDSRCIARGCARRRTSAPASQGPRSARGGRTDASCTAPTPRRCDPGDATSTARGAARGPSAAAAGCGPARSPTPSRARNDRERRSRGRAPWHPGTTRSASRRRSRLRRSAPATRGR